MATPKLQTTITQRAAEIPTENILPMLPDGRFVVIGKDFYFTNTERCSCGSFRMQKGLDVDKKPCKHMKAVIERAN